MREAYSAMTSWAEPFWVSTIDVVRPWSSWLCYSRQRHPPPLEAPASHQVGEQVLTQSLKSSQVASDAGMRDRIFFLFLTFFKIIF